MNSIQYIEESIQRWNNLTQAYYNGDVNAGQQILNLLLGGEYFKITRQEFDFWQSINPLYIHCYLGIGTDNKLKFFLLDSINDGQENFDKVIQKDFLDGQNQGDHDIEEVEVIERKNNWQQFNQNWLNEIDQNTNPILRAIQISFSDYQDIFSTPTQKCSNFFALRDSTVSSIQHDIEIIIGTLLSAPQDETQYYVDVTRPVPPFGGGELISDYKLLS